MTSSDSSNSVPAHERLAELASIVANYARQRKNGELVSKQDVVAKYPHLMPELAEAIDRAEVELHFWNANVGAEIIETRCPQCQQEVHIRTSGTQEAACPQCGARIHIDATVTLAVNSTVPPEGSAEAATESKELSLGTILGKRYEVCERIGAGGMAVVYRVRDQHTRKSLALKILKNPLSASAQKRFEREFRAVSTIRHPNCVEVFDFGSEAQGPYFTMELFSGRPITALRDHPLSIRIAALLQAVEAIDFVHSKGIIHRDVKPSNLLVKIVRDSQQTNVLLKLTDFGLAKFNNLPSSLTVSGGFAGTLLYSAPEQIINDVIDQRADLYALGIVCYELLTGTHPFETYRHEDVRRLIHAHLTVTPPSARHYVSELPERLDLAIQSLLAKQPVNRPASTGELREALLAFSSLVEKLPREDPQNISEQSRMHACFVARRQEMAVARQLLSRGLSTQALREDEWREPHPSVLLLRGDAGIGKSRMLQEIGQVAEELGGRVLLGRCFEGNLAPYQPFVDILYQLLAEFERKPSASDHDSVSHVDHHAQQPLATHGDPQPAGISTIDELVRKYGPELLRLAPELRELIPGEAFRQVDISRESHYILRAAAGFFIECAKMCAICLCIDDLQWADQGTLDLLRHVSSGLVRARDRSGAVNVPLVMLCTSRPGQHDATRLMDDLSRNHECVMLDLQPLTRQDVAQLITQTLGPPDDAFVELLHRRSQGNPFFVCECLRSWLTTDRLNRIEGRWTALPSLEASTAVPESVRDLIRSRLDSLSGHARRLMATASVIGTVVDLGLLRSASSDLAEAEFQDVIDELIVARVLLERREGQELLLTHDLIREVCYQELSASRRAMLHRRVAEVLESRQPDTSPRHPELLAAHFLAAGIADKAFVYLLEAAEAALSVYAIEDALLHLLKAKEVAAADIMPSQRLKLHRLLGIALTACARAKEAIANYQLALKDCEESLDRARILDVIGQLHFRVGEFDQAVTYWDHSLSEIGFHRPRSLIGTMASIVAGYLRWLLPNTLQWKRKLTKTQREATQIARDVFNNLCYLWAQRSVLRCSQSVSQQFVLGLRLGDVAHRADAYGRLAWFFSIVSLNASGMRAAKHARNLADLCDDAELEAIVRGHIATAHYYAGRLDEAERLFHEALPVLDRRGDSWMRLIFYHNLRHLYAVRGDTTREIAAAKLELEIGEAAHDSQGRCWGAYGLANALARSGRTAEAEQHMQQAMQVLVRPNIIVVPTALQTYGYVYLQSGDYESARAVLEEARAEMVSSFAYVDYSLRCFPLLIEAILGPLWYQTKTTSSRLDVRHCARVSRWGLFWARRLPNTLPHALRACGRVAWVSKRPEKARQYFLQAIRAAELLGAEYDLARACLDLARIAPDDGNAHEQRGHELLSRLGAVLPPPER